MGGGGGIFSPITDLLFGSPKTPDITYTTTPTIVQTSTESAGKSAEDEAASYAENAVAKEAARRRKAKGYLSTIITGQQGDTSTAPIKTMNLGGVA